MTTLVASAAVCTLFLAAVVVIDWLTRRGDR